MDYRPRRPICTLIAAVLAIVVVLAEWRPPPEGVAAARPKKRPQLKLPDMSTPQAKLQALEYFRRTGPWTAVEHTESFASKDLDKMLDREIKLPESRYAPAADDATFIRRATLDLTGHPPEPGDMQGFVADRAGDKREKLIDKLLETDDFARRWAHFWRNVMFYNAPANPGAVDYAALEKWLAGKLKDHAGWDRIAAELLSADGKKKENGPDNFPLAFDNQPTQLASETARIFMGVSIQCAECHDHPFDRWKRRQFHELAAFFSRGAYYMPDLKDPDHKTQVQARFLLGEEPAEGLPPDARRVAVAAYLVYNPKNYWFARAYVNRVWSELLGDGFYAVDSLGPDGDAVHKMVVNRMAYVFRNQQFDPRWPFRTIMNARVYQRQARAPSSAETLFTSVRPSRLRADQVAAAVRRIVGNDKLDRDVDRIFSVDPSIPPGDVEGAIQQALFLMNNPTLQAGITNGPLTQRLVGLGPDEKLADELYLGVLARLPTERERRRTVEFLQASANRPAAVADSVWILVNSAEFIARR